MGFIPGRDVSFLQDLGTLFGGVLFVKFSLEAARLSKLKISLLAFLQSFYQISLLQ